MADAQNRLRELIRRQAEKKAAQDDETNTHLGKAYGIELTSVKVKPRDLDVERGHDYADLPDSDRTRTEHIDSDQLKTWKKQGDFKTLGKVLRDEYGDEEQPGQDMPDNQSNDADVLAKKWTKGKKKV